MVLLYEEGANIASLFLSTEYGVSCDAFGEPPSATHTHKHLL